MRDMGVSSIHAVLSDDIPMDTVPADVDCMMVEPCGEYVLDLGQHITTFRSTDQGTAFLIQTGEGIIYHAGDLNDWVWEGESPSYNDEMTRSYRAQIDRVAGIPVDIAFVVLDPRQEKDYARGMLYFLEKVPAKKVWPMHYWEKPEIIEKFLEEYPQYQDRIVKG